MPERGGGLGGSKDTGPRSQEPPGAQMTRQEWIAYHVARAPKITMRQWTATLTLLRQDENLRAS